MLREDSYPTTSHGRAQGPTRDRPQGVREGGTTEKSSRAHARGRCARSRVRRGRNQCETRAHARRSHLVCGAIDEEHDHKENMEHTEQRPLVRSDARRGVEAWARKFTQMECRGGVRRRRDRRRRETPVERAGEAARHARGDAAVHEPARQVSSKDAHQHAQRRIRPPIRCAVYTGVHVGARGWVNGDHNIASGKRSCSSAPMRHAPGTPCGRWGHAA